MAGPFDTTLGALLIGAFVNTYLYGLTSAQYGSYITTDFGDPLWMRSLVGFLFCMETVHSASVMYLAWEYMVTHYADPTFIMHSVWPLPFSAIVVSVTAFGVQSFLAWRMYRLLGFKWLLGVFLFVITGTLVLGFVLGVRVMRMTLLPEFMTLKTPLTVWLSMEVVIDSCISAILFVKLQLSRTGFSRSDAVLNRLTRSAIQSGTLTSIMAILALVCFLALPNTLFYATFAIPIARAYTYSLMDTLLCRKEIRGILHGATGDTVTKGSMHFHSAPGLFGRSSRSAHTTDQWHSMQGVRKDIETEVRFDDSSDAAIPGPTDSSAAKDQYLLSDGR